jgi:Protein of unknown function (DUF1634)
MKPGSNDRLERWLRRVLGLGTYGSAALLAAGLVLQSAGVDHGFAERLTRSGLVVLMITPASRVVVSVVEYTLERDWLFTVLTGTVLAILLGGAVLSMLGH